MSGARKPLTESEVKGEENQIRIGKISLPPGDGGEAVQEYTNRQLRDCKLNDKDSEKVQASNSSVPNEYECSTKTSFQQSKMPLSKPCNSEFAVESHVHVMSDISLLNNSPSLDSPFASTSPSLMNDPKQETLSPSRAPKLFSKSSIPCENVMKSSFIPISEIDSSDSCVSSNTGSLPLPPTPEIPLPVIPPLPASELKSPTLKYPVTVKTTERVTKASEFDSLDKNIESVNLESDKFTLYNDSLEGVETKLEKCADLLPNCMTFSPVRGMSCVLSAADSVEKKKLDDSRYSPSRLDSDEEGGECTAIKPKVLGKEQAKKRLMAFSLSKQPANPVVRKQNKLISANKIGKEKPPNPNKSAGVQEQFRATISAIEEEKKRMMQNMPSYLFMYRNNLSKVGDTVIPNTSNDKTNRDENVDPDSTSKINFDKDDKDCSRSKSGNSSPSKSKTSRQRRSSSSRRSSSRSRRYTKEKYDKKDNNEILRKIESVLDWNSFVEAGLELDSDFRRFKLQVEEKQRRKDRRRSRSPEEKSEHKPIFNYLKKGSRLMVALQAKASNPGISITVPFQEKTVKYTRTKPMITWAENPSYATDFFMPKQMLLDNCDKSISSILYDIMEQRCETQAEAKKPKQRLWYPQFNYLIESENPLLCDVNEEAGPLVDSLQIQGRGGEWSSDKESAKDKSRKLQRKREYSDRTKSFKSEIGKSELKVERSESNEEGSPVFKLRQRRTSLVDDNYLSEDESEKVPVKEVVLGDVKVQLDLGSKRVKVRSKWDSDYEGEETDSEPWNKTGKAEDVEVATPNTQLQISATQVEPVVVPTSKSINDGGVSVETIELKTEQVNSQKDLSDPILETQNSENALEDPKGTLVSEYEEFMKMVSFGAEEDKTSKSEGFSLENVKIEPVDSDKFEKGGNKKIEATDWDQESDRDDKPLSKKISYMKGDSPDSFSLLLSGYDSKKQGKAKSSPNKKSDKARNKKTVKKVSRNKKYREETSSESSSDSSDSDSDTDSDSDSDSDSDTDSNSSNSEEEKRKRKKRKVKKLKKYSSSSDSESESDGKSSKSKKIKGKKKRSKGKRSESMESSDSNEEIQSVMLKQLDFKKQQIIKKIEEIDSISGKNLKKLKKGGREESSESEETDEDSGKEKKKAGGKVLGKSEKSKKIEGKGKRQKKSDKLLEESENTESEREERSKRGKNDKKRSVKKSSSSSSSDDGGKEYGKVKNVKKRKVEYSSSSESDSDSYTSRSRKKNKKKKKRKRMDVEKVLLETSHKIRDWNDHLLSDGPDFKTETLATAKMEEETSYDKIQWSRRSKTSEADKERKGHKDLGDWEESSSEESLPERRSRESSWDEDFPKNDLNLLSQDENLKERNKGSKNRDLITDDKDKFLNDFNLESKHDSIFNDNSSSNIAHDVFSSENSASMQLFPPLSKEVSNTSFVEGNEKRNFHGIGADFTRGKTLKDELYSPGHTDSDLSDSEEKRQIQMKNQSKSKDVYDPLNSDSDASTGKTEIKSIPLPCMMDTLQPVDEKKDCGDSFKAENTTNTQIMQKSEFIAVPPASEDAVSASALSEMPERKRMISVKLQQKFQCKVASVFQNDSEEEEVVEPVKKSKTVESDIKSKIADKENEKPVRSESSRKSARDSGRVNDRKKTEEKIRERSRDRSKERRSRDRHRDNNERYSSPRRRRSLTPDSKFEERDSESRRRKGDGYGSSASVHGEDERKERFAQRGHENKSESVDSEKVDEVAESDAVRPIPVLTGLNVRIPDGHSWGRSHVLNPEELAYSCDRFDLMDPAQMDFYGSQDSKTEALYSTSDKRYGSDRYDRDYIEGIDVLGENRLRKDKRRSRSRSSSPKKWRRSKSPDRRRSPRHRSSSPRRRGRSPFSPRRRGSPRRRYRGSRSPDRKKSRSPRKRRHSPLRRSRSTSPRKHRGRFDSPRRSLSPGKSLSPRRPPIGVRNLIHVVGVPNDDIDMSPMAKTGVKYDSPMGFSRSLADSTISDSELNNAFYNREYPGEYGGPNYPEELPVNNLITLQNHDVDKQTDSPKRLTLDQRIEIELGVPPGQNDQYQMPPQSYQQFPEVHSNQYHTTYPCDNSTVNSGNQNFYPNQGSDFSGQFFNGQQPPPNFGQFSQYPRHNPPGTQNSVLQVGNIMEVVPTMQAPPPPLPVPHAKGHQIMQVGNVLQVVPSPKPVQVPPHNYGVTPSAAPDNQKGSVMLPQSAIPNAEAIINPLIKAIQLEREKRKKEKEKRRAEREARRKARQLRREAKLMSVNEKLKKSVQDEGLMLGQEVEEDELLEEIEHPSPPVPVEIVTDSSQYILPPAGKGILITAGFIPRPASEKKEVKFADGICPGEGTSTSGGEDRATPPPKPKLPKEKRYKKKKTKLKKKVKVHIIRQVIQAEEDEDEDELSPPPPPPGDPPPVFFARFPFGTKAQYPVYQTQTTTTTLTTVQFPTQSYP